MSIAEPEAERCSPEEWQEFRAMVSHGMLFEVVEWIDKGHPTLRPEGKTTSAFGDAVLAPNHSMTKVLWEGAYQDRGEVERAISRLFLEQASTEIMRYAIAAGCPLDDITGSELCQTHDLDLVRLGMERGVNILEPEGWATAFRRVGSRPLIRFYLEERDRIPGLKRDAVCVLCECIRDSRLRAVALLLWAGVDPLAEAPRYDPDDPEADWSGFPALYLGSATKVREILKLLKLKPTIVQWFELLDDISMGNIEYIDDIFGLLDGPNEIIREHPDLSENLLRRLLQTLCWTGSWNRGQAENLVDFSGRLLDLGIDLRWEDARDIAAFRSSVYRSESQEFLFKALSKASETAREASKSDLVELVRTDKMRGLVIRYNARILSNLGLKGPVYYEAKGSTLRSPSRQRYQVPPTSIDTEREPEPREHCQQPEKPFRPKPPQYLPHANKNNGGVILTRKQIYADVWAKPTTHVAKRYGISGSMLARICTKLQIPRPSRGYWARSKEWRKKHKKGLPAWKGEGVNYWAVNPRIVKAQRLRSKAEKG